MSATFLQPLTVEGSAISLGASAKEMEVLLPKWEAIPEEFKSRSEGNEWVRLAGEWLDVGLVGAFVSKSGINTVAGMGHCSAILRSGHSSREHKVAGVAYLMSLWFERFDVEVRGVSRR